MSISSFLLTCELCWNWIFEANNNCYFEYWSNLLVCIAVIYILACLESFSVPLNSVWLQCHYEVSSLVPRPFFNATCWETWRPGTRNHIMSLTCSWTRASKQRNEYSQRINASYDALIALLLALRSSVFFETIKYGTIGRASFSCVLWNYSPGQQAWIAVVTRNYRKDWKADFVDDTTVGHDSDMHEPWLLAGLWHDNKYKFSAV